MQQVFSYFQKLKQDLLTDTQIKIAYQFKKYLKLKKLKVEKEKETLRMKQLEKDKQS